MKSAYIAIAMLAIIAAVVLLSGCTSGPASNATATATMKATVVPTVVKGAVDTGGVDAAGPAGSVNTTGMSTPWPEIRSGNNTSVINTSEGMREVPNSDLAKYRNNTTAGNVTMTGNVTPGTNVTKAIDTTVDTSLGANVNEAIDTTVDANKTLTNSSKTNSTTGMTNKSMPANST